MITENEVFKYVNGNEEKIRVIHIKWEKNEIFFVNLDIKLCTPTIEDLNKFKDEIENNILFRITDPYFKNIDEGEISKAERKKRDLYANLIIDVWENRKDEFLYKKTRNKILKEISDSTNIPVITIRRVLSRFWQRGMTKNALLPDYINSGARGKERKLSYKKVGRPKKTSYSGEITEGINITEDIKKQFELEINRYYRTNKKISLNETYNYLLRDFFSDKYIEDNETKYKIWDKSRIPTYDQFYYWFKKFENPKKDIILRNSAKEFELKHRPILSNSILETDGPGTRFQIDATIADIYLVSSLNRNRIIGRPIVYDVIDVFSRLITGIYVGLEGPSWLGAMMALDNMITDKVEFCRKYGIEITEEQWPSKHLPEIIIADRGEFEGYSVENLINNLNIKIENTSPYRGDLKGIVERNFRTINTKLKHKTPGAIQKEFRERGDRDYRLDATLTMSEFTEVIINLVLDHNSKLIEKYPMQKEMVRDGIAAIPIKLWNWGIENKKGRLRVVDQERFRLNILPRGKAGISRAGIRFKNLYYGSQKAIEEQWFIKSKVRSIEIVYDPRNMNQIYISDEDGINFEKCYLLEGSKQYKDCILEEIIFNEELASELRDMEKEKQTQIDIDIDKEIEKIIRKAKDEKKKSMSYGESNSKKLKNIRNNRAVEKELNREDEAFNLGEEQKKNSTIVKFPEDKKEIKKTELTGDARLLEMLRRKRDEKRDK